MNQLRVGIDTGGTFTDVILYAGPAHPFLTHKLLSTPDDPAEAVLQGLYAILRKWCEMQGDEEAQTLAHLRQQVDVVHGSTVATNALLERKAGRVGLLATAGFEDVLWIARQNRPALYALQVDRPAPPMSRERVVGVRERMGYDGEAHIPLDESEIDRLIQTVRALDVEALAICLLHSYANAEHEERIAAKCREVFPDLHLTVSHELLPEFREYERTACCVVNAAVAPPMVRYLRRLGDELGESHLRIMGSNGGCLPPHVVERYPILTCLSGPAGGVLGALKVMQPAGMTRLLTLDMGGTSTDVALCDGVLQQTTEGQINQWPLRLSMLDIETVGAGGGSIARIDAGGALQVGPASMGASPGPACYGLQQEPWQATVTDAHLVLGHLSPRDPLAGSLLLSKERAYRAVQDLAERAGGAVEDLALGILKVAEATMARAIQRVSVARGVDPRDFVLVPFGGAGGLHACQLAASLGMTRVGLPPYPGLLSALGMLGAAPKYQFSQAILQELPPDDQGHYPDVLSVPDVQQVLEQLQQKAEQALLEEGYPTAQHRIVLALDLRYLGQSYEITVSLQAGDPVASFLQRHQHLYGYLAEGRPIQVVAARVEASVAPPGLELRRLPPRSPADPSLDTLGVTDQVYSEEGWGTWRRIPRDSLRAGDQLTGPLIISEYSATTVVPPGWHLTVHPWGQISLMLEDS